MSAEMCSRQGVRASAGSGKTYELTTFYLRHLLRGTSPHAMLATTFTRKAAGEILGRVITRLCDACDDEKKLDALVRDLENSELTPGKAQQVLLEFCRALHQVRISTIDSFFGQMLRGYCHDAGVAPDVRMADKDSPEVERVRREAIRCLLASQERESLVKLLDDLSGGLARRGVVSSLSSALQDAQEKFEVAPDQAWEPQYALPTTLSSTQLEFTVRNLQTLSDETSDKRLAGAITTDIERIIREEWEGLLKAGIVKGLVEGKTEYYRKPISDEIIEAYGAVIDHLRGTVLGRHVARTRALRDAISLYHEKYSELLCRERILLFSDVPRLLAKLFLDQSGDEVAHRMDARLECLLLDEFQDTSPQQYAILTPFAQQIAALPSNQGLLFCVGDTKQSIYGWRGGTPKLFDRLGVDFSLRWKNSEISYRSSPTVLRVVNDLFGRIGSNRAVPAEWLEVVSDWQSTFREHQAHKKELTGYVEVVQSPVVASDSAESIEVDEENEAVPDAHLDFAARRIEQINKRAPGCSIGVLLRSNEAAGVMLYLLQRLGVPAASEGGEPIANDAAVSLVLSALHFAEHPSDTASLCHLLNSPLREEIEHEGGIAIEAGTAAWKIRRELAREGYSGVIGRWAQKLAPHCDAQSTLRLMQLLEMADAVQSQPVENAGEFVERVRAKPVEGSSPAPVRVMTIHKSKGLEFDIVVLPELHKPILKNSGTLLWTRDERTQEINRICAWPSKPLRGLEPALEEMYQEYAGEQVSEALCTLYVAMTRARQALHLIVPALKTKQDGSAGKTPFSFASLVRTGLCGADSLQNVDAPEVLFAHGDAHCFENIKAPETPSPSPAERKPREYFTLSTEEYLPRARERTTPSSQSGAGRRTVEQLLRIEASESATRGSAMHALLSRIEWIDNFKVETEELIEWTKHSCRGVSDEDARVYVQQFQRMLPKLREYFAAPQTDNTEVLDLWRERRFATMIDSNLVTGTFDRVAMWRDTNHKLLRAELIDFKTGCDDQAAVEYFSPQLEIYRKALAAMLGLPVEKITASLFFVDSGKRVDL